jgi:hypothetical protein
MKWAPHNQQHSPSYPLHYPTQAYQNSQTQPPAYYQSYHYATTNHPQPSPIPQITYHPTVQQIMCPTPSNTNANQVKTETNPLPPSPPPQVQEPLQQPENFPTHGTILTITEGSNTNFKTKRPWYHTHNHRRFKHKLQNQKVVQRLLLLSQPYRYQWSHHPN